jgi:hypothetical protein
MLRLLRCCARSIRLSDCPKPWRSARFRLFLEYLEDRDVPSTFTVSNLNDSGAGSFRQAILDANAHAGMPSAVLRRRTGMSFRGTKDSALR